MLTPKARDIRRAGWAVTGVETGVALFIIGLLLLHSNPFWRFDDGGFLDWRVHWWNFAGEILTGAGLLILALSLLGLLAAIVSRCVDCRSWPYVVAALLVFCAVVWIISAGHTRHLNADFEWDAGGGFSEFRLQELDEATGTLRPASNVLWQSIVKIQIQPLLRGYFKLNDWQKMNGHVGVAVIRILPVAWPIALGSGGEALEDPDETALMRAAAQEDLKTVQQLLSGAAHAEVNALDQGGQTALILACQNSQANPEVIKALLASGADVNLRSRNGYAALTWALARNNTAVVRLLRRAGGKP